MVAACSVCARDNNLPSFTQSWPVWQGCKKEAFFEEVPYSHLCALCKNTSGKPRDHVENVFFFFAQMRLRLNFLGRTPSVIFGKNQTQHTTQNTPYLLWSVVGAALCCGNVALQLAMDYGSGLKRKCKVHPNSWGKPSVRHLKMGRSFAFQQDRDPKHTCKITEHWFKDRKVSILTCPSIENLWLDLKRAVPQHNLTELEQFCM